ncbi:MAG TPA: alpha-glucan family phosphorylase [Verrucomicrobiae bacterium]|nr:alpha-glucan family phosphorylase [Verrucomicrobiae bacterium]
MSRTVFTLESRPRLPESLNRLDELAGNLAYAWERRIRAIFARIDPVAWNASGKNPRRFLRSVPQAALDRAASDVALLEQYHRAVSTLEALRVAPRHPEVSAALRDGDEIAYFCAEFGLHESLPIYSGGLGVLAGDHLKASSELGLPLVAVGLLYRQGYFTQTLDADGRQHAMAHESDFSELPVAPCLDPQGREVRVSVEFAERQVQLRVWRASIGQVPLYLLDSDLPENEPPERAITYQLYGGDADMRIRQELVLGIGGLRALRALGHAPTAFHLNEGHAAFLILERIREEVAGGLDFESALERTAGGNVFTTHTPVAAGHDVFAIDHVRWFLRALLPQLGTSEDRVLALGCAEPNPDVHHGRFNMTTLALRGSRFHNGVSGIHGRVARRMERALWPQVRYADVPIRHVTNGVHLRTFLAGAWERLFDERFPDWRERLLDPEWWACLDQVPDERFASVRRELKHELLEDVAQRLARQMRRSRVPEDLVRRALRQVTAGGDPLVLGFARRFATYKRATLPLLDEPRLARLLNDPQRPALLLFAGKAHPRDAPGQALIQRLYQASLRPEFIGKLIVLEGYDLRLARHLVQGCDVWLNTPEYPLEACGTSGQKAGINGTVNVSVLDGWWDEGFVADGAHGPNGYAVVPADLSYWQHLGNDDAARAARDVAEGRQLLDILEEQVAPTYYAQPAGYAPEWLRVARNSMKTLIPRYNSARMAIDYARDFYGPASRQSRTLAAHGAREAKALSQWKARVRAAWPGVSLRALDPGHRVVDPGACASLRALATLNGLAPEDVVVECELGRSEGNSFTRERIVELACGGDERGETAFTAELEPVPGVQHYRLRMRPQHPALSHAFELGCVVWA